MLGLGNACPSGSELTPLTTNLKYSWQRINVNKEKAQARTALAWGGWSGGSEAINLTIPHSSYIFQPLGSAHMNPRFFPKDQEFFALICQGIAKIIKGLIVKID